MIQRRDAEQHAKKRGFTLVELLVVIAIIGVLVSMLMPAVQSARESARRASCMNNIAQVGLAVHNYEFAFECLPPGVTNDTGPIRNDPAGQHVSWIVNVLPFIEENNIYRKFDQQAGAYADVNAALRTVPISVLICPSDLDDWSDDGGDVQTANKPARSSYAGCHHGVEAPIDADNNGLLFLNSRVRYRDILDGSTKTLLLGETRQLAGDLGWASGTRATLRNTGTVDWLPPLMPVATPADEALHVGGFGSHHAGGVAMFTFADGAVQSITDEIDPEVLQQLGNRADGEVVRWTNR